MCHTLAQDYSNFALEKLEKFQFFDYFCFAEGTVPTA